MNTCACGALFDPGKGTKLPRVWCPACRVQQRTCETCGRTFEHRRRRNRDDRGMYCSVSCSTERQRSRFGRTCVVCGGAYRATYTEQVTCGRECGMVWHTFNRWGLRHEWRSIIPWSTCPQCDAPFVNRTGRKHCTEACARASVGRVARGAVRVTACRQCGREFSYVQGNSAKRTLCDPCAYANSKDAKRKAKQRYGHSHRSRARYYGVAYEPINRRKVFDRDGWRCYLCRRKVHKFAGRFDDPLLATVDHVVAMSRGGGHTWDNVRCACHECNSAKSDQDVDYQLTIMSIGGVAPSIAV